jgi:hypothetical protein
MHVKEDDPAVRREGLVQDRQHRPSLPFRPMVGGRNVSFGRRRDDLAHEDEEAAPRPRVAYEGECDRLPVADGLHRILKIVSDPCRNADLYLGPRLHSANLNLLSAAPTNCTSVCFVSSYGKL